MFTRKRSKERDEDISSFDDEKIEEVDPTHESDQLIDESSFVVVAESFVPNDRIVQRNENQHLKSIPPTNCYGKNPKKLDSLLNI